MRFFVGEIVSDKRNKDNISIILDTHVQDKGNRYKLCSVYDYIRYLINGKSFIDKIDYYWVFESEICSEISNINYNFVVGDFAYIAGISNSDKYISIFDLLEYVSDKEYKIKYRVPGYFGAMALITKNNLDNSETLSFVHSLCLDSFIDDPIVSNRLCELNPEQLLIRTTEFRFINYVYNTNKELALSMETYIKAKSENLLTLDGFIKII